MGCYSPCSKLIYDNWNNSLAKGHREQDEVCHSCQSYCTILYFIYIKHHMFYHICTTLTYISFIIILLVIQHYISFISPCYIIILAIFHPSSQFCEINISLLSLQKQPNTAPNLFQRGVEYGKYVCAIISIVIISHIISDSNNSHNSNNTTTNLINIYIYIYIHH